MNLQQISNNNLIKRERLEFRITKKQKRLFQQAANIQGRSLSDFLATSAEKAAQEIKKNISVVYVLNENNNPKILGYFTLSSYSVALKELPIEVVKKLPKYQSI